MAGNTVSYKCPSCGAPIGYIPSTDTIKCEYCDTVFKIETLDDIYDKEQAQAAKNRAAKEATWHTEEAGSEWSEEELAHMHAFTCSSCGAEIICDENTMATECCYCGNPTMLPSRFSGMLKPDFVIPFKKTKEEAVAALEEFYKGKKLLPDKFTANNRVQAIQGMYVPFWLFNSDISASGVYKAENDMVVTTPNEIITTTSVYRCERSGSMRFERIPVDGSKKMDDSYMESIEPFDYSELVPFSSAYLSGFLADKYDVDAEAAVARADERVCRSAEGCLENTVTGYMRSRQMEPCAVFKENGAVQYAMVPVWILTTQYEGKPYTFMMNGQTGRLVGSLPADKNKLMMYSAGAFIAAFVVLYLLLSNTIMK